MGRITRSRSTCNLKYDEYSGSGSMQYNPLAKGNSLMGIALFFTQNLPSQKIGPTNSWLI